MAPSMLFVSVTKGTDGRENMHKWQFTIQILLSKHFVFLDLCPSQKEWIQGGHERQECDPLHRLIDP